MDLRQFLQNFIRWINDLSAEHLLFPSLVVTWGKLTWILNNCEYKKTSMRHVRIGHCDTKTILPLIDKWYGFGLKKITIYYFGSPVITYCNRCFSKVRWLQITVSGKYLIFLLVTKLLIVKASVNVFLLCNKIQDKYIVSHDIIIETEIYNPLTAK